MKSFDSWLDSVREQLFEEVDFEAVMTGDASCRFMQKRMLKWLEAAYNEGKQEQLVIYLPIFPNPFPHPTQFKSICPKCKMDVTNMSNYYCSALDCPVFMKVTCITSYPADNNWLTYNIADSAVRIL